MTAKAAVAQAAPPLTHTTTHAERLRQTSATASANACAGASVGTPAERLRQNGDRDVLEEMKEKEEEELSAAEDVYRRILGRIALCEKWMPHRRLQAAAGDAGSR